MTEGKTPKDGGPGSQHLLATNCCGCADTFVDLSLEASMSRCNFHFQLGGALGPARTLCGQGCTDGLTFQEVPSTLFCVMKHATVAGLHFTRDPAKTFSLCNVGYSSKLYMPYMGWTRALHFLIPNYSAAFPSSPFTSFTLKLP